jgi:lysophospholipase L1-like esterase
MRKGYGRWPAVGVARLGGVLALIGLLGACATSSGGGSGFSVFNPYAPVENQRPELVRVATLRVFGDSYSVASAPWGPTWSAFLTNDGTAANREVYALSGARAASIGGPTAVSFTRQVDTWIRSGSQPGDRDLSVVYFGYNDIGRGGTGDAFAAAKDGLSDGLARMAANGAIDGERRIFLTQIHDWSKNPGVSSALGSQVRDWNAHVANVANSSRNYVAVDLYTVLERVYADPGRFGLANVTTADPARAGIDALYYDNVHFGPKGAQIIARTYRHYLTRGWDWANRLAAGAAASQRLNTDIDAGLLNLTLAARQNDSSPGLRLQVLGGSPQVQAGFAGMDASANRGVLIDQADSSGSGYGVALLNHSTGQFTDTSLGEQHLAQATEGFAAYWRQSLGEGWQSTMRVTGLDHEFSSMGEEDLLAWRVSNRHGGNSLTFDQRLTRLHDLGAITLAPWVGVTHQYHRLDAATVSSAYTSDVRFDSTSYNEQAAGAGLYASFRPWYVGSLGLMQLGGHIGHWQVLDREDLTLTMREANLPGVVNTQVIEGERISRQEASLNLQLRLNASTDFGIGIALQQEEANREQSYYLQVSHRF